VLDAVLDHWAEVQKNEKPKRRRRR
jgi:hypothetical protein